MKAAVLFSGGKDSCYSLYLAKKKGYNIACLISIFSENKESYMFHTPSISQVKHQANSMGMFLVTKETKGEKEKELEDLEDVIRQVKEKYEVDTLVTGAIRSEYQLSRIKKICDNLGLNCFNPLWQKDEMTYLEELIKNKFNVIITGVFAFPLDEKWLGRKINGKFIKDAKTLNDKYRIHVAGEGGEFETFVVDCPLFKKPLKIKDKKVFGEKNSWRMEIEVE